MTCSGKSIPQSKVQNSTNIEELNTGLVFKEGARRNKIIASGIQGF